MKIILLLLLTMSTAYANAQLTSGHYSLTKKEYLDAEYIRYNWGNELCECDSIPNIWGLGLESYCASLDVFGGTIAYFKTGTLFDTGNTRSTAMGDYLIVPIPVSKNRYVVKSKLIELEVEVINRDEVEVTVYSCVMNHNSRGIFNRYQNIPRQEKVKYYLKKKSPAPKSLAFKNGTMLEPLIKSLGINYNAYKVFEDKVIWEDITGWDSKQEVREVEQVDAKTFEVYKYQGDFHLISEAAHRGYPPIYSDYAKDSNHVYYQGQVVKEVNPTDFEVLDPLHAKTSKNAYCRSEVIPAVDIATFESLNGGYTMDKNHYYREGKVVRKDDNIKKLLKEKQNAK